MKIEIGEYVRTKKGKIFQYGKGRAYLGKDNEIVKHSKNTIDLLEVGDLINKSEVYELGQTDNGQKWIKVCNGYLYFENDLLRQTILTKEQYIQNCYKCQDIENGTI